MWTSQLNCTVIKPYFGVAIWYTNGTVYVLAENSSGMYLPMTLSTISLDIFSSRVSSGILLMTITERISFSSWSSASPLRPNTSYIVFRSNESAPLIFSSSAPALAAISRTSSSEMMLSGYRAVIEQTEVSWSFFPSQRFPCASTDTCTFFSVLPSGKASAYSELSKE